MIIQNLNDYTAHNSSFQIYLHACLHAILTHFLKFKISLFTVMSYQFVRILMIQLQVTMN